MGKHEALMLYAPPSYVLPHHATKDVRINKREPQNWEALRLCPLGEVGVGAWLTPKASPYPYVLPRQIC